MMSPIEVTVHRIIKGHVSITVCDGRFRVRDRVRVRVGVYCTTVWDGRFRATGRPSVTVRLHCMACSRAGPSHPHDVFLVLCRDAWSDVFLVLCRDARKLPPVVAMAQAHRIPAAN